jgi:hypothetical protein
LEGPKLAEYKQLAEYVQRLWAPREANRYGSIVEPMLQWAKIKTAREKRQVVPCKAGVLSAVVYSNGDVSVCETHRPLGNIRDKSFNDIWHSEAAEQLRASIRAKDCYCTNEIFLWPSITFQPKQLVRALVGSRAWRQPKSLPQNERADWSKSGVSIPLPVVNLRREPNMLSPQRVTK